MLERLKKLEGSGLTPLPPPPVTAPAARPSFGPDRPGTRCRTPVRSASRRRRHRCRKAPCRAPVCHRRPAEFRAHRRPRASSASCWGRRSGQGCQAGCADAAAQAPPLATRAATCPAAPSRAAVLLGGLDAPTGGQAQRNPQPVLLRLADNAILPNQFRARVKECFIVGAGYGDVSSERAYIRTESLSCVTRDGTAIDVPVKGYVAGEDGKAGMRGRLVSKQGQILANALLAGVASGIGHAFTQSSTTLSVSPLGTTSTVDPASSSKPVWAPAWARP